MSSSTINHLDNVYSLIRERRAALIVVRNSKIRRRGIYQIALSTEEKEAMTHKVKNYYQRRIAAEYEAINNEIQATGREALNNPFERN